MCDLDQECFNVEAEKPTGHISKIKQILEPSYKNLFSFFERYCMICEQKFETAEEAIAHAKLHSNINVKCPLCPKIFNNL